MSQKAQMAIIKEKEGLKLSTQETEPPQNLEFGYHLLIKCNFCHGEGCTTCNKRGYRKPSAMSKSSSIL